MKQRRSTIYMLSLAGLFLSGIVAALLVLSVTCLYGYGGRKTQISFQQGELLIATGDPVVGDPEPFEGWFGYGPGRYFHLGPTVVWWPAVYSRVPLAFGIPLWLPLLVIGIPSTITWRRHRPALLGPKRVTFRTYLRFLIAHLSGLGLVFLLVSILGYGHWAFLACTVVLFLLTPLAAYIWSDLHVERYNRRIGGVYCQTCGYNLTGNTSGVCPECGSDIPD